MAVEMTSRKPKAPQPAICRPVRGYKRIASTTAPFNGRFVVEIEITIYVREEYYEKGRGVAQVYPETGEYKLKADIHFKPPSDDPNKDIDTRTEVIEREFSVLSN